MVSEMLGKDEPWQAAEIPGPKKAMIIAKRKLFISFPQVVTSLIRRSKNPILIAGHKTAEIKLSRMNLIDYVIQLAEAANMPVASSPRILGEFIRRGFKRVFGTPIIDVVNRIEDPSWAGFEGKGPYDLVMLIGFDYHVGWLFLSSLKHFSRDIKTVSLDMYYQPHASWSFPNIARKEWETSLETILNGLRENEPADIEVEI